MTENPLTPPPAETAPADADRIARLRERCRARKADEPMPGDCRHPDYKVNLDILKEIGEWAACGFYEAEQEKLPWPRAYGLAYRRLYENMAADVPADRLLIPCEPFFRCRNMRSDNLWSAAGLILDFNHHCGLKVNPCIAAARREAYPQHAAFIDRLCGDLGGKLVHFGGYTHSNPDIRRVVDEGFLAMEAELDDQLAAVSAAGDGAVAAERNLLLALKDYTTGVKAYHATVCAALAAAAAQAAGGRKTELDQLRRAFATCFLNPSRTFLEGLLAVNFTWMLDGCDSIGRFDQALGRLYEADLASGVLDPAFAERLLDEFWQGFETLNGWNLQLGGATLEGADGTNALTRAGLAACARNRLRRPNVALRLTRETPDDVLVEALQALANGSGKPALYNDDRYVESLRALIPGLTARDAREVGFGGCTETMLAGLSNVGSLEGYLNLAKALELALFDGFDPVARVQAGPHTGRFQDFPDFDAFLAALKRQIQYQADAFVARNREELRKRFDAGDPKLYRTFFTRDCVKNRKSFEAGGARYNWAVVSYQGIANTIDGAAAIRKAVFDDRSVSAQVLIDALSANFSGYEAVRQTLSAVPKFGNDDDYVDLIGRDLLQFAWDDLQRHETPRGGRYLASCILFTTYLGAGKQVGATPDGRLAFEALVDSVGAVAGRDRKGPTALLNSVAKLPLGLAVGTPVLNLRFQKSLFGREAGVRKLANLIRTFFRQGGMQIQLSVIDPALLRDALAHPDAHRDILVRIGGYSEYFHILARELQETVIRRTEYGL